MAEGHEARCQSRPVMPGCEGCIYDRATFCCRFGCDCSLIRVVIDDTLDKAMAAVERAHKRVEMCERGFGNECMCDECAMTILALVEIGELKTGRSDPSDPWNPALRTPTEDAEALAVADSAGH